MSRTRIERASERGGAVAHLTLCGAERLNVIGWETFRQLESALADIARNDAIRVVCISGAGEKAFCAGADVDDVGQMDAEQFRRFADHTSNVVKMLAHMPKIVIAAVNGIAFGAGCAIVMASDLVFAVPSARFAQPEIKLGIVGGAALLPRRIASRAKVNEMVLLGSSIDAHEAMREGLVNRIVDADRLTLEALACADELLAKPARALSLAKQALVRGRALADESAAFDLQQDLAARCMSSSDTRDAIAKFRAKRMERGIER
jgi:enoyl-CoA hydratase